MRYFSLTLNISFNIYLFVFDTYVNVFYSKVIYYKTLVRYNRRYLNKRTKRKLTIVVEVPEDSSLTLYTLNFFSLLYIRTIDLFSKYICS